MREKDLKRAYNNVLGQTISASRKFLFAGNRFGDIFVLDLEDLDKSNEDPPSKLKIFHQSADVEINCLCYHRNFLIVGAIGVIYGLDWDEETRELSSERKWEVKIPIDVDAVEVPDVNSFWLCENTDTLYAGCGDSIIYQISLEDGRIVRSYRGHADYIHAVTGNTNGQLYSASEDGTVRLWTDEQKECIEIIEPYKHTELLRPDWGKWIGALAANNDWLVCGGGPKVAMWHLRTLQCTIEIPFPGKVHVADFIEDCILVAGEYDQAQFYTLNGQLQASIPMEHTACYSAVWQTDPIKFLSISGFSNKLHILKDFRFLDSKIEMYGNIENEDEGIEHDDFNDDVVLDDDSDNE